MIETNTAAKLHEVAPTIWDNVPKNKRYLSEWESDTVIIDSRIDGKTISESFTIPLSEITIIATGELSIYDKGPISLSNFPEFLSTLKYAINSTLRDKKTHPRDYIMPFLNQCIRFFAFVIGKGVYKLSDVSRDLVADYQRRILQFGWWHANNYDFHLREFVEKMKFDESIQKNLQRKNSKNYKFSINIDELQKLTGLRIPRQSLPAWFYDEYRNITNETRPAAKIHDNGVKSTQKSADDIFDSINLLCFSHRGFNTIPFIAFPNSAQICKTFFKDKQHDKRTKTLTLPVAVAITQESLRWLYEYGPSLLEVLNDVRRKLEEANKDSDFGRRQYLTNRILANALQKFQDKHQLAISELDEPGRYGEKFRILSITYQSAIYFNVGLTTARRRNEISGEKRTYGLYFGCLRKTHEDSEDYKADFYIEKSLQAYREFWVPKVCVDSIRGLEELSQAFRPLGTEKKVPNQDLNIARLDKLFTLKTFKAVPPHITESAKFVIAEHSEHFLRLCGVDRNIIFNRNRSVTRRLYCNLYVNRYDNPVAAALQHHLDHSHMGATAIYAMDPHGRSSEEKAATIFRQDEADDESFHAIMAEVSHKHHVAKIVDLLEGKPVGGLYSRLILKLTTRLSKDSNFALQLVGAKAQIIGDKMNKRGFASSEKGHGMCMAGTARHTLKKANCARGGEIHPEDASPELCNGCINLMNPEGYQHHLAKERDALLKEADDMMLPRALREAKRRDAAEADAYLEASRRIAEGNKQIILKLVDSWSKLEEPDAE